MLKRFPLPQTPVDCGLDLLNRAMTLAVVAYDGLTRKDGVTPQVLHPLAVQRLLAQVGVTAMPVHAAALLHDALEDNPGARAEELRGVIAQTLGGEVLQWVEWLTDDPQARHLPRSERKALQRKRLEGAPLEVRLIKLADVVASVQEGPAPHWTPQYAAEYVAQRRVLVEEVLQSSCAEMGVYFQHALAQPVWQQAYHHLPQHGR